ncbi:MAG: DUF6161 domain-containing protein [Rhodospirillaceae bacterium]|nr:DUF6161 domain-containing protein [Rhodospirillaceae bacterium]
MPEPIDGFFEPLRVRPFGDAKDTEFKDYDDLVNWARKEHTTWRDLLESEKSPFHEMAKEAQLPLSQTLLATAEQIQSKKNGVAENYKAIVTAFAAYEAGKMIAAQSDLGRLILSQEKSDPKLVPMTIAMITGRFDYASPAEWDRFKDDPTSYNLMRAERTIRRWQRRNARLRHVPANTINEDVERLQETITAALETTEIRLSGFQKTFDERLQAQVEAVKSRVGLQHPKEYWKTKAGDHKKEERRYWWFTIASFVVGAIVLGFGGEYLLDQVVFIGEKIKIWPLGLFLLGVSFVVWWLRLMSRLYLSSRYLKEDAAERAVMIETFVDLTSQPGALEFLGEPMKVAVLDSVFRPSSKGVTSDDGPGIDPARMAAVVSTFVPKAKPGPS